MRIYLEIFGYIGSALVVFSMLMTSVLKLRVINTMGSIVSMIYALICHTYPIAIMNLALILINLYGLKKLRNTSPAYHLEQAQPEDVAVRFLLGKYKEDIKKYFAGFTGPREGQQAYVVMNEDMCVAVALGTLYGDSLELTLDYATPSYRDFSIGSFLYGKLKEQGVRKLIFRDPTEGHRNYLLRMNFTENNGVFTKEL